MMHTHDCRRCMATVYCNREPGCRKSLRCEICRRDRTFLLSMIATAISLIAAILALANIFKLI